MEHARRRLLAVPCWIYLRADEDAITCEEPADVIVERVENAEPGGFIHFDVARLSRDDSVRTGYIRASDIVAVMPMHPRQVQAELDDPPDWLQD
jgi:hypothetical protein